MVTENTIQDIAEQSPETQPDKLDLLLAEIKGVKDTQGNLERRLGYALRKMDALPEGRSDPVLVNQVTQIQKELETQRLAQMSDEEIASFHKTRADNAERIAAQGVAPIQDARLKIIVENYYDTEAIPIVESWSQDAGLDLTPAIREHLKTLNLHINEYTGDVNPTFFLKDAFAYLRGELKAQLAAAKVTTPADDAGPTLGDSARPGGGRGRGNLDALDPGVTFDQLYAEGVKQRR